MLAASRAGDELAHAVEGDAGLLAAGQHAPDHPRQEAEPAEVGDEQGQRADVERAGRQGAGADEQHEPEPDVGGALAERHHALVEHAVADRRVAGGASTSPRSRASMASVASLTLTVVAAAITSPTSPVTAAVASRSAAR